MSRKPGQDHDNLAGLYRNVVRVVANQEEAVQKLAILAAPFKNDGAGIAREISKPATLLPTRQRQGEMTDYDGHLWLHIGCAVIAAGHLGPSSITQAQ